MVVKLKQWSATWRQAGPLPGDAVCIGTMKPWKWKSPLSTAKQLKFYVDRTMWTQNIYKNEFCLFVQTRVRWLFFVVVPAVKDLVKLT